MLTTHISVLIKLFLYFIFYFETANGATLCAILQSRVLQKTAEKLKKCFAILYLCIQSIVTILSEFSMKCTVTP